MIMMMSITVIINTVQTLRVTIYSSPSSLNFLKYSTELFLSGVFTELCNYIMAKNCDGHLSLENFAKMHCN